MASAFLKLSVFFMGLVSNQVLENYDYCDSKLKLCNVAADHVMCKYPFSGPSDKCTPEIYEPLSVNDKERILALHNHFRNLVANAKSAQSNNKNLPPASNMRELYWDKELELLAERWAEQCVSSTAAKVYDDCRNIRRFQVSQNVGTRRANGTIIEQRALRIVVNWFKNNKNFLPAYVDEFPEMMDDRVTVKQFANMILADSYTVGCARAIFRENISTVDKGVKKITTWAVERLICNYGPGGNIVKKALYKRGSACENCPDGTECSERFSGLCAIKNADSLDGLKTEENKGSSNGTTRLVSAQEISETNMSEEKESEDGTLFTLEDTEEDDGSGGEDHNTNFIDDIIQQPETPTLRRFLVKKGIYINGKCHCSEIRRSRGRTDFSTEKWIDGKETRKREVASKELPRNGDTCNCYIPVEEEGLGAAPGLGLSLFCVAAASSAFLL